MRTWAEGSLRTARIGLVGRASVADEIARAGGARLTDFKGYDRRVAMEVRTDPVALSECDVVIVTVKSTDTAKAVETLARRGDLAPIQ
ncbi:MAG: 2-dehydropantoate 2-reductase N-terminal domain-containing protein [Deltaproteobacteria bacterium]|nr:2-dehydropantoate 2-reductase N-terminal domain-containing protein [Deltaproteobacteria bacterium]